MFFSISYTLPARYAVESTATTVLEAYVQEPDQSNASLARTLTFAVEKAGKPRHQIARDVGINRETLLRVMRGERAIGVDEAARIFIACGAAPQSTMLLAIADQERLACEWMRSEMGEFLEAFLLALPIQLERTLGRRMADVRPRWASGTAQLLARLLAKHIDDFAERGIGASLDC
jgi:DNA-binding phage protein